LKEVGVEDDVRNLYRGAAGRIYEGERVNGIVTIDDGLSWQDEMRYLVPLMDRTDRPIYR